MVVLLSRGSLRLPLLIGLGLSALPRSLQAQPPPPNSVAAGSGCDGEARPLVWRARRDNQTAYILGIRRLALHDVQPLPDVVHEVVKCADVVYFELACADGDYGSFLNHCTSYPVVDPKGSIKERLSEADFGSLHGSVTSLLANAAPDCSVAADRLRGALAAENAARNRTTLGTLRSYALSVLDAPECSLHKGSQSYEDWLRDRFSSTKRPAFGLEDISVRCQQFEGRALEQDSKLAHEFMHDFSDEAWVKNVSELQASMAKALRCGGLASLTGAERLFASDPADLAQRRQAFAKSIGKAIERHAGKQVLMVIDVAHLINLTNVSTGVVHLLHEDGFNVERLTNGLGCKESTYTEPGAKELNQCLEPVWMSQPKSCDSFKVAFEQRLGKDEMYGRTKYSSDCANCVSPNVSRSCECTISWTNTSSFQELCRNTSVDGVHGQVLELDLIRNPGSSSVGTDACEKKVRGIFQNCYATSCDIPLLEETHTRVWYSTDPTLSFGKVTIRPAGSLDDAGSSIDGMSGTSADRSRALIGLVAMCIGAVIVVAALMCCFMRPRTGTVKNKVPRGGWAHMAPKPSPREPFSARGRGTFSARGHGWVCQGNDESSDEGEDYDDHDDEMRASSTSFQLPADDPVHRQLLLQAMLMKQKLGEAGAQAVQQLKRSSLQGMHQSVIQSMQPIPMPGLRVGVAEGHSLSQSPSPYIPFGSASSAQLPSSPVHSAGSLYRPQHRHVGGTGYEALSVEEVQSSLGRGWRN
mmetsp:Transcript_128368/g.411422  ORF Transcript_128368/g.411422 Transcript_128368/m.411422 type:complete len:754 (+) Transcript_128368:137-2398(+)